MTLFDPFMEKAACEWAERDGKPAVGGRRERLPTASLRKVVIETRVRLARNLADTPFPDWALRPERERIRDRIFAGLRKTPLRMRICRLEETLPVFLALLREEHMVSQDLLDRDGGAGLAESKDGQGFNMMINEEDHLRIQGFQRDLDLLGLWKRVDAADTELSEVLPFAWSERLGYLTACPSNLGTGLRASVMMHLPGLGLMHELDAVIRGLERLNMTVRGVGGEGSEATGFIYQISNAASLGFSEIEILYRVEQTVRTVADLELKGRDRLRRDRPRLLEDTLSRTLALLRNAKLISAQEAVSLLSIIRLGVAQKWLSLRNLDDIDLLMQNMQPAHFAMLNMINGRKSALQGEEADSVRASWLNGLFRTVILKD